VLVGSNEIVISAFLVSLYVFGEPPVPFRSPELAPEVPGVQELVTLGHVPFRSFVVTPRGRLVKVRSAVFESVPLGAEPIISATIVIVTAVGPDKIS
jgi:hypothetical protein